MKVILVVVQKREQAETRNPILPVIKLQDMKTLVSSSGYLYSPYQMEQFSLSNFSQKQGIDLDSSLLEQNRLKSSKLKVPLGSSSKGSFDLGSSSKASSAASSSSGASSSFFFSSFLGFSSFFVSFFSSLTTFFSSFLAPPPTLPAIFPQITNLHIMTLKMNKTYSGIQQTSQDRTHPPSHKS